MLTPEQQADFRRRGILRVPGAVPSQDANAICAYVWEMLRERYQISRDDPETWNARRVAGTHDLPKSMTFEQVASPAVCAILDDLLGPANWDRPDRWASLLVTFPESRERWNVPHQSWHLDAPVVRSMPGLYGVRLFTCLAKLAAGGGGTLAVAGSYRLAEKLTGPDGANRIRSAEVRKALIQRHRWMKGLCSSDVKIDRVHDFMDTITAIGDVDVGVVEMTGDAGDVILMHPLTMHAASPNCLNVPRMVLSTTVYQRGVDWATLYVPDREAAAR
jgi:hypothetical protein